MPICSWTDPHTPEIIEAIAASGAFVVACVVLDASMMGITGAPLADDPRVAGRLSPAWDATLRSSFDRYPQGRLSDVLATVRALDAAGVDLLIGSDVSQPLPFLGGLAHGASVHQELQYFVDAGISPSRALSAATAVTARRFGSRTAARSPWASAPTSSWSTATRRRRSATPSTFATCGGAAPDCRSPQSLLMTTAYRVDVHAHFPSTCTRPPGDQGLPWSSWNTGDAIRRLERLRIQRQYLSLPALPASDSERQRRAVVWHER